MPTSTSGHRPYKRRSTRVEAGVFLDVRGVDGNGQAFMERRVTLEVSYHGCRYFSRYALQVNSWVTMDISNKSEIPTSQTVRARVAWCRRSKHLGGLFLVGVEFEAPGNVWGIANPPEDWRPAKVSRPPAVVAYEREMNEMLTLAATGSYYQLLRATAESPRPQIRQSYYELVRKYHPDRHMDHPEWTEPLNRVMEAVTSAYKTLSDDSARQKYDDQLASSGGHHVGLQNSEKRVTAEDCMRQARQCLKAQNPGGTILWLRRAVEMEPESSKYHTLLARAMSAVAALRREATEHFEKALEIDPWNTVARIQLAALYEELDLPWRARQHFAKVLEFDPDNAKVRERLNQIEEKSGKSGANKRSLVDRILHPTSK
jgi:curved DNA-binding protein CbpA